MGGKVMAKKFSHSFWVSITMLLLWYCSHYVPPQPRQGQLVVANIVRLWST